MRRLLAVLLLALAGCAPAAAGPQRTNALEQVSPTVGVDVAAARQAVVAFVESYAQAGEDGGARLLTLAGTRKLLRWAQWVGVQVDQFPGQILGQPDVREVGLLGFVQLPQALGAQLDLEAVVTLTLVPEEGTPERRTRVFHGPVAVFRRALGDWAVVNIFRDGLSLDAEIHLVDEALEAHRVTVELDSVFSFVPEWSVNLVVSNRGAARVRIRPDRAAIVPAGGGEAVLGAGGTPNLRSIPPGARDVPAILTFPAPAGLSPDDLLELPVEVGRAEVVFRFPLGRLVSLADRPPTASPAPPG